MIVEGSFESVSRSVLQAIELSSHVIAFLLQGSSPSRQACWLLEAGSPGKKWTPASANFWYTVMVGELFQMQNCQIPACKSRPETAGSLLF